MCIYIDIKSVDDDQEFHFNDKKDRLKLKNTVFQKILENKKVS